VEGGYVSQIINYNYILLKSLSLLKPELELRFFLAFLCMHARSTSGF
jgi:hypothetical protein